MAINRNVFMHESDKAALQILKSIPGFTQLLKAFMKVWDERLFHIMNMATNVKISENQMPEYHNMLPPICEKLGIEVPELYMKLDVIPNAYTYGDTKPFIVMTSGLIETIPEKLIPTVLAHECGHIACRHVLYRNMGQMILNGALLSSMLFAPIAAAPLRAAFAYWMRCSELSADRAAVLCDGSVDNVIEMCIRFAGFDKDIPCEMNIDAFMEQAQGYQELVDEKAINKAMSFLLFYNTDHPINAVRAYECKKWEESEDFYKARHYFEAFKKDEKPQDLPISWTEKHFLGRNYEEVEKELMGFGFYDVELIRSTEKARFTKEKTVINVDIQGSDKYKEGDWYSADSIVEVKYYLPFTDEEIAAMHPGEVKIPEAKRHYIGKTYQEVVTAFAELGFNSITLEETRDIEKEKDKNLGKVESITINMNPKFSKGDWIDTSADITIIYHAMKR